MSESEESHLLVWYGKREIFERRLREGYVEIARGSGPWIDSHQRIAVLWVFYSQDGRIATYEHPKMDDGDRSVRGQPFEAEYAPPEFEQHVTIFKLTIGARKNLADLLQQWPNETR